jgi:hypothetical protein
VVSSLTHPSNVIVREDCNMFNTYMYGRENSLEKRNYAALHLKKKTANKLYCKYLILYFTLSEKIFQQLNLE